MPVRRDPGKALGRSARRTRMMGWGEWDFFKWVGPKNMTSSSVAGVILAAGQSRRFQGHKLLAEIGGKALPRLVLEATLESRLSHVAIVVGDRAAEVEKAVTRPLHDSRVSLVRNPVAAIGQSTSVIAGLRAVMDVGAAVMFLMGDQPLITAEIIDALVVAFEESGKAIVYPRVDGRQANPVIFGRRYFARLLALSGDVGGRGIINAFPGDALGIEFDREIAFRDVDRVQDLQLFLPANGLHANR